MMRGFGAHMSLVAALFLGACAAQGPTLNVQAEQMELALVGCKAQLGLVGRLQTEVSFEGGVATARAVPFDRITDVDADRINLCAGQSVTLADGMEVVSLPAPQLVQVGTTLPVEAVPMPVSAAACPARFSGMYAGTLYCTGGAL